MSIVFNDEYKFKAIKMFSEGRSAGSIGKEIGTSADSVLKWTRQFINKDILNNFTGSTAQEINEIRENASRLIKKMTYDDAFKYTVIEQYCEGFNKKDLSRMFNVNPITITNWIKKIINDGSLYEDQYYRDNKEKLLELQKRVIMRSSTRQTYEKHNPAIKCKALTEYLRGASYEDIFKKYSIADYSIRKYVYAFADNGLEESTEFYLIPYDEIEELHTIAVEKAKELRKGYNYELVYKILVDVNNGDTFTKAAKKHNVSNGTPSIYYRMFITNEEFREKVIANNNIENPDEFLQSLAAKKKHLNKNDEKKYEILELYCKGMALPEIENKYRCSHQTVQRWLRQFAENGPFTTDGLSEEELVKLELLQEAAKEKVLQIKKKKNPDPDNFDWLLEYDEGYKEWALYAEEWIKTQVTGKASALNALSIFFKKFIIPYSITKSVREFLSVNYIAPDFYEILFSKHKDRGQALNSAKKIVSFVNWILIKDYSVEDDYGVKCIPHEFNNCLASYLPNYEKSSKYSESNKDILPYKYIKHLKEILFPANSTCFRDLSFAQNALMSSSTGGDWYIVDKKIIDESDPDCVFRKRQTTKTEFHKGFGDTVYEMWFPGRAVGLLMKLMLPLRTFQVRMLDSGEMDTYKYIQLEPLAMGEWILNDSKLSRGTPDRPIECGVLRKFTDPITNITMTGFFINTNKTADVDKPEDKKGYNIPWQYEEMQYWVAKLRDWQQKYNPIDEPTLWTEMSKTELGRVISPTILKQRGASAFLFRSPLGKNNGLPLGPHMLDALWYKLLQELEEQVHQNATSDIEKKLKFVDENSSVRTYFPLHSLRVSLITAYALDGGVPMPILSKCIAGHARLIMTLYYTKMGISYVTDEMTKAEKNLLSKEQESFDRFIRDAQYQELESNVAVNDIIAYQAVINARKAGVSLIINDKGMCPKSCLCCDTGGVYFNDDTSSTTYGPVEGYPEQNCVRCRWFITGPAFLPGLTHHFNVLSYNISETAKRIENFQNRIEELENRKYECEVQDLIFDEYEELTKYEQLYQQEIQKNNKFANDLNATLRLIDKCKTIVKNTQPKDKLQLVPVGSIEDVEIAINHADDEIIQLQSICNGAEIFPETDASKAVLQRAQILDLTLLNNGCRPIMLQLSEDDQLIAGNQFMRILMNRTGSLKDAVPYAVGRKKLEDIGLTNEFLSSELESYILEHKNHKLLLIENNMEE